MLQRDKVVNFSNTASMLQQDKLKVVNFSNTASMLQQDKGVNFSNTDSMGRIQIFNRLRGCCPTLVLAPACRLN